MDESGSFQLEWVKQQDHMLAIFELDFAGWIAMVKKTRFYLHVINRSLKMGQKGGTHDEDNQVAAIPNFI